MIRPSSALTCLFLAAAVGVACSSSSTKSSTPVAPTASNIKHLVVLIQENHSFDSYFAGYCTAETGSKPTCSTGPACCEKPPAKDPGSGMAPVVLNDAENGSFDPNHTQACENTEIDDGKMDMYVTASGVPTCGSPNNFAEADATTAGGYWDLATKYALADQYFQPVSGQSSSNDIYLARAAFEFADDDDITNSAGVMCGAPGVTAQFNDETIGDLMRQANVPWAFYSGGYQAALTAQAKNKCPSPPSDCPLHIGIYPCIYDPTDNPFEYFEAFRDNPTYELDFDQFGADVASGSLRAVSYVKAYGYQSEHPGSGDTISTGLAFTTALVNTIMNSPYADDTLLLVTWDESGGFYDHVAPPAMSAIDKVPYGARVPLLAIGNFVAPGTIAHTQMEHSSIVKFIEWNWLGEKTGQLGTRDTVVNNIGSLLDPSKTGVTVPVE